MKNICGIFCCKKISTEKVTKWMTYSIYVIPHPVHLNEWYMSICTEGVNKFKCTNMSLNVLSTVFSRAGHFRIVYNSQTAKLNPECQIPFCFFPAMCCTWEIPKKGHLCKSKEAQCTFRGVALAINKQHIFTALNHNFNAVAPLAGQKGLCPGRVTYDNTFQNKFSFSKLWVSLTPFVLG